MNTLWAQLWRFPGTWGALLAVAALEGLFLWWFRPPAAVVLMSTGAAVLLAAAWIPCFARSQTFRAAIARTGQALDVQVVKRIQALEEDLRSLNAEHAVRQLRGLREKLQGLTGVVERRLNAGELAYGRYLGTAQQVYLSAVDNLHEVAVALRSKAAIDPVYIEKRLGELPANGAHEERETLLERHALLETQNDKVTQLLSQNETAMTALSNTAAALAAVRTERGHAKVDATTAMSELEQLASRARHFEAR
jgi:hypothetical protein